MNIVKIHIRSLLILFLALQVLNLSLDSMEFQPLGSTNTILSFNDLNTAIEYVAEIVLNHENAFPEYVNSGKSSQKNYPIQKQVAIKLYYFSNELETAIHNADIADNFIILKENYLSSFVREITPPPPKASILLL